MKYATEINDASRYGITAARAAYNASIPAEVQVTPAVPATEDTPEVPAVMGPNPDLLTTDEAYLDFVLWRAVQSWCQQYAPVVTAPVPDVTVNGVPQSITPGQGELQLLREGLLGAVTAALANPDTPPEMRIAFARATVWERTSPSVVAMLAMLGKSDTDADAFFTAAAQIKL